MDTSQHQIMGYDRAITVFSPDGRLLQVEYAKKTVRQGSTAIGFSLKEGVVLIADKRIIDPLIIPESLEKIYKIDDHIIATASGILSDARILIERSQLIAQQHKLNYDSDVDVITIVKDICNLKQVCTQSGGLRPFGVSLLIAGIDKSGNLLFETDPTGIYFRYKADVIGEGESVIKKILEKEYKEDLSIDDAIKLSIKALKEFLQDKFDINRIEVQYIKKDEKKIVKLTLNDLKKYE